MTSSESPANYSIIERRPGFSPSRMTHGIYDSYSEALNWLANYNRQLHDTQMGTDVSAIINGFFSYYSADTGMLHTVLITPEGEEDE